MARFEQMYAEYSKYPLITKQRMFYETMEDVLPSMRLFIIDENGTQKMLPLDSFTAAAEAGRSASRTGAAQNSSAGVNQQSSVSAENSSASGTGEEVAQ